MRMLYTHRRIVALGLVAIPLALPPSARDGCPHRGPSRHPRPPARVAVVKGRVTEKSPASPSCQCRSSSSERTTHRRDHRRERRLHAARRFPPVHSRCARPASGTPRWIRASPSPLMGSDGQLHLDPRGHAPREVVTTATGEQSRREMGNTTASLKADSIVKTSPITNVTETAPGAHGRRAGHSDAGCHRLVAKHSHPRRRLAVPEQRATRRR